VTLTLLPVPSVVSVPWAFRVTPLAPITFRVPGPGPLALVVVVPVLMVSWAISWVWLLMSNRPSLLTVTCEVSAELAVFQELADGRVRTERQGIGDDDRVDGAGRGCDVDAEDSGGRGRPVGAEAGKATRKLPASPGSCLTVTKPAPRT